MKYFWVLVGLLITTIVILSGCSKDTNLELDLEEQISQIPKGFPSIVFPIGNEYTKERWLLGKRLFYDKRMSKNNTISCGSCHKPNLAFSDNISFSNGDNNRIGTSNVPTLTNIAYNPYLTRSGGVPTLEMHVLVPIQEHNELNTNIVDLAELFNADNEYHQAALNSYGRSFDSYVLVRAIANFERSFISGNSSFDEYNYQGHKNKFSESEKRGFELFMSKKTECSSCHSGFNFTNYAFENNGLYENYKDSGRMRLTKLENDRGLFKVPTLRNIEYTAPYMHDGSIQTLEQIIEHYNNGGKSFKNKSELIKPLNLTNQEKQDLVNFLKTLTDIQFLNNKKFKQ